MTNYGITSTVYYIVSFSFTFILPQHSMKSFQFCVNYSTLRADGNALNGSVPVDIGLLTSLTALTLCKLLKERYELHERYELRTLASHNYIWFWNSSPFFKLCEPPQITIPSLALFQKRLDYWQNWQHSGWVSDRRMKYFFSFRWTCKDLSYVL